MDDPQTAPTSERNHRVVAFVRAVLALIRPEYIPTVFSACVAGWYLGGGGAPGRLPVLITGSLLLFTGGAFLSNAADVALHKEHRWAWGFPFLRAVKRQLWKLGLLLLLCGTILLQYFGPTTGAIAIGLALLSVLRNAFEVSHPASPLLRAPARLLYYLLSASVAVQGINGVVIWCGIAAACSAGFIEFAIKSPRETSRSSMILIPAAPVILALFLNSGAYLESARVLSCVLAVWTVVAVEIFLHSQRLTRPANLFAAALVLVDMLAVCPAPPDSWRNHAPTMELAMFFTGLFCVSVISAAGLYLLRRFVGIHQPAQAAPRALIVKRVV